MKPFASYENPSIAIDLVVFGYQGGALSVLLLNRKERPFKDQWTLPGGFLQMEETFQATCSRILRTKLGMDQVYLEQLYSFDALHRDPRGRVISVCYFALVNPSKYSVMAGTMANDVSWFAVHSLPSLGFDHNHLFETALKRLQAKILYYPVGFELMDDEFTLPDLHRLYECILGLSIDRRNFRRKIIESGFILPTGEKRTGAQNRHPDIYKFNKTIPAQQFSLNISF